MRWNYQTKGVVQVYSCTWRQYLKKRKLQILRMSFTGTQKKCRVCDKTVYLLDQLAADGAVYHRACFRCHHCQGTLKLSSYASLEGVLYCKPHFDQLFRRSGSFTKSLEAGVLSKISNSVEEAEQEKAVDRLPSLARVSSTTPRLFSGTQEKCAACSKIVYPLEKVSIDGLPYHKFCFKCAHGGCVISPSNYAALEGRVYCKHHYQQLFKEKGDYSQLVKAPSLRLGPKSDA